MFSRRVVSSAARVSAIGRRSIATANNNYVKRLIQDANNHPSDPERQLRVLQVLNRIHPSLVVQRVDEVPFVMSAEAHKEYMKALVRADRIDSVDLNQVVARMQNTTMMRLPPHRHAASIHHNVNESGYRAWAAFASLTWGTIVTLSLLTFWNEEGWKEEHPMTSGFMRGLELHMDLPKRSVRPRGTATQVKKEPQQPEKQDAA
ncbi:Aste57867_8814 [Aphanomyces stellatus]|uniref:Aste57867_8814 protein n=1 Tax=Aphanomyces stellatus TaxID=120398 RepID=A0A485KLJ9_9STRA|nr:hypothetical protein As57867_008779 [Aphanomyces stellatus]VFT85700.1 Aste57867_8814 [Aphanomyces stellatus]